MSDMDKLLAARFFFEDPGRLPLEVKIRNGKFEAGAGSRDRIFRFELWSKGLLLFWTHCRPDGSEVKVSGDTLTIDYVVRNALFTGIDYRGDSSVNDVGPLAFRLVAEVGPDNGPDKSIVVASLTVGKPVAIGFYQEFKGYEVWSDTAKTAKFYWRPGGGARSLPLFLAMGAQQLAIEGDGSLDIPIAIRRAKNSESNQYRIEISLGLSAHTRFESVLWPQVETDGVPPLTGPRLRLSADARSASPLEYGVPLDFDSASKPPAYSLVQTDPWGPPVGGSREVWREFRIERLSPYRVLKGFERIVSGPIHEAVLLANEADGISALPQIESPRSDPNKPVVAPAATATIAWQQRDLQPAQSSWGGVDAFGPARNVEILTTQRFPVQVTLPAMTSDGGPMQFDADCAFVAIKARDAAHGFMPNTVIELTGPGHFQPRKIDIGAMRIDAKQAEVRLFRIAWGVALDRYRIRLQRPSYRLECHFGDLAVKPGGFDAVPRSRFADDANSDRLPAPILAEVAPGDGVDSTLRIEERLRDDRSRSLKMSLGVQAPAGGEGGDQGRSPQFELIVLDQAPFFIGKIAFQFPKANNAESNDYAGWSLSDPEGPRWRFRSLQPDATLTLPTQGVGEAYERRKDIDERPAGSKRAAIGYRLGPHAEFKLRLRDDERAYSDLPWNLRLLFGRPGEAAAGPLLSSARFELLYGLESTLRPAGVRLTTDEIQRGRIAQRLEVVDPESRRTDTATLPLEYSRAWNALVESYQSRLLSLQPYRPLEAGSLRFDQDSGLSQRLRIAKTDPDAPLDATSDPIARRNVADLHARPYLKKDAADKDTGLRGGATFGFESRRIYEAVTRELQSTSGELSRVAWTALGGYGALKARFDEERSIIEANVELGRVSHYAVERIGRIGVFWNRAKHVIVYERTTQRAERYGIEGDKEEQNLLKYLPIVRKIDEYVEILEPERRFAPAGQPAQATGFVQGLKFADRIIRVSSLWGVDVGDVGWSVPLWRRDQDAKLFPKPLVNLLAASEEAGEEALHAIADPEHLRFFTNTVLNAGGDTDLWPAVEGVDFVDALARVEGTEAAFGDRSAESLRRSLPSSAEGRPALAACTWRIEDGERPIDLIAGRGQQPISAKLRNLTVMRKPVAPAGEPSPTRIFGALLSEAESIRLDLRDTVLRGLREFWDEKRWLLEKDRIAGRIEKFKNSEQWKALEEMKKKTTCDLLVKQAHRPIDALSRELISRIGEEHEKIQKRVLDLGERAQAQLTNLADDFRGRIDVLVDKKRLVLDNLDGAMRRTWADIDHAQLALHAMLGEAVTALHEALDKAGQTIDLKAYRTRISRARQAVEVIQWRSTQAFSGLDRAIETLSRYWKGKAGKDLPSKLKNIAKQAKGRVERLLEDIDARLVQAQGVADHLEVELEKLQQDIRSDISGVETAIESHIDALHQAVEEGLSEVGSDLDALSREVDFALDAIRVLVSRIERDLRGAMTTETFLRVLNAGVQELSSTTRSAFDTAKGNIEHRIRTDICPSLPSLTLGGDFAALQELVKEIEVIVGRLSPPELAWIEEKLKQQWDEWSKSLDNVSDGLRHALDSLGESVRTAFNAPLSLLRAFGAAPNLPELSFNREWLEYVFDPSDLTIDISPVTSFFAELGDDLKGLSLNLPSIGLDASGLLPAALRDFDLNAVFGSLGGVKMPGLLSRVKLPNLDRNAVKVTHGFDKKTKRAWVQADVDVPYRTNPVLFDAMSLALRLVKPKFSARSRMEAGLGGNPAFYAKGEIASTIRLEFSGNPLVDLRDASIRFDDRGQFDFDFSPDRIDFKAGLKFLADLIRARSKIDQDPEQARGFVPMLIEADGLPIGVRTTLELDPGPLNFGAFSIDGLALNLSFELVAKPEFRIGTRLSLASPDKPFVLSVGLLGGGGWLAVAASYLPSKGLLESEVDIALAAGRVFSVNFGPIRGMAQVVFGVNARFVSRGSRSRFSLIVFFLFSGNFRLWGIITVKIGRFFKRTVRQRVNYRFAGKSNGQQALAGDVAKRAITADVASPVTDVHGARAAAYLARYED